MNKSHAPRILGTLLALLAFFLYVQAIAAAEVTPLPDVTTADGSMGTCYSFYELNGDPLGDEAYAAGSRWDRFDFRWNVIEDSQGVFNFAPHDNVVNIDRAHDIDIVGILGSTAAWATSGCPLQSSTSQLELVPGHPPLPQSPADDLWWRNCPPDNLNLAWDDPLNYWGNYVYETVSHFKDRVHVWEIWNEPDLGNTYWTGSAAEYAQLLKIGYQAVKAADPQAKVLFGGLAYWSDPNFYIEVLDTLPTLSGAASHNYYFDALSLHLYSNVYGNHSIPQAIQSQMQTRVGWHPIWLTETGVPLWDEHPAGGATPYPYSATIDEAAAYTIEAYAMARAAGVEKFFFFRLHDEAMSESFGLIRNDGTLRPAYVAYQVAARYLHGENQITGPFGSSYRRVTFLGTPYGRIDVLWNATATTLTYTHPAIMPAATLVNQQGISQTLGASNDQYTLTLAPASANTGDGGSYIIGGPPQLLIQSDPEPPTSTLHPINSMHFTPGLTLTWEVSDTLSGYWYTEIERAPAASGPWTRAAGWGETNALTQTQISLPSNGTWYFRARARDNVGNWESWPASAEISTTLITTRSVAISLSTYIDTNSNGLWDDTEIPPTTTTTINWQTADGTSVASNAGISWTITKTVDPGEYAIAIHTTNTLPYRHTFEIPVGASTWVLDAQAGLLPLRSRIYLPQILREG